MFLRKALLVFAAAVSAYGQTKPVPPEPDTPIVKRQPPIDMQGLWQVLDPKTGRAVASFNISQNGTAFTMQFLSEGKPDVLSYEGTLQGTLISGKIRDFRSADELWVPLQISMVDHDHLQDSHGIRLTRATAPEAGAFREFRRVSSLPLPAGPFDLNGIWGGFANGVQIAIRQNDGEVTLTELRSGQPPFFRGLYAANPRITGQRGMWSTTSRTVAWNDSTITVVSPDHLSFENKMLYRISNPASHDLACDDQNSNRVRGYYAWLRGAIASSASDYESAKCWLTIGTKYEYAPALSMLSALLLQDGAPDYPRAFDLATRGAAQGDVPAELQLASLYREGKGTAPDPVKASYWQQKAQSDQSVANAKLLTTPGIGGFTPMDIGRMILDGAEVAANSNPMAGGPCFSEIFVPAGKHPCK